MIFCILVNGSYYTHNHSICLFNHQHFFHLHFISSLEFRKINSAGKFRRVECYRIKSCFFRFVHQRCHFSSEHIIDSDGYQSGRYERILDRRGGVKGIGIVLRQSKCLRCNSDSLFNRQGLSLGG